MTDGQTIWDTMRITGGLAGGILLGLSVLVMVAIQ